ncbi:hypothetical protein BDN67DRAFT_962641 [Paxillus ammoniavirescens]|nr:hypothetical protein BDN67DRAFT_962641 [Paxillus ammoniavirescens]
MATMRHAADVILVPSVMLLGVECWWDLPKPNSSMTTILRRRRRQTRNAYRSLKFTASQQISTSTKTTDSKCQDGQEKTVQDENL